MLANYDEIMFRIIWVISAVHSEQFISSRKQSAFESSAVSDALFHIILKDWYLLPFLSSEYSPCLSRSEKSV